jgi:flagellar hook-length control protein FliK
MISPIDIISYDTRPQEFESPTLPLHGPSFSERLVLAEDERSRTVREPEKSAPESAKAAPLKEAERVPDGGEPRTGRDEAAEKKESPTGTEKSAARDRSEESVKREKTDPDTTNGRKGDVKSEAPAADGKASKAAGLKSAENGKADKNRQTLLQRRNAFETERETGEKALAHEPEAVNAAAGALPNGELSLLEANPDKEPVLRLPAETGMAEANALPQTPAEDAGRGRKASGSGEKERDRRAERHGTVSAVRGQKSRPTLELVDLRRGAGAEAEARQSGGVENGEARSTAAGNQISAENGQILRQEVMVLETSGGSNDSAGFKGEVLPSRAAGELAKALREGGNSEILKRAQITLKDANQGEIRLILKPERLGEVRIRLNLSDRHIAGRIIVENSSVREAFQENMEALNRAFRESGYQTAGLEVSVGGREGSSDRQKERAGITRSAAREAAMLDEQVPRVHSDQYAMSRINVYV